MVLANRKTLLLLDNATNYFCPRDGLKMHGLKAIKFSHVTFLFFTYKYNINRLAIGCKHHLNIQARLQKVLTQLNAKK